MGVGGHGLDKSRASIQRRTALAAVAALPKTVTCTARVFRLRPH
jgi:hypothetical protein